MAVIGRCRPTPAALPRPQQTPAGAGSGGITDTREMLDFCAAHDVTATVEVLPVTEVNTALDRLAAGDVKYRFVLDLTS